MKELAIELLRSVNWGEVITSLIQTILYFMIPIGLELATGVLGKTASYLETNKENSWMLRLMSDVATTMNAQWQVEAKDIRKAWDEGKLTKEEWDKQKIDLKNGFHEKMLLKLKKYPAAYADKFESEIDDHMEAWLAQNKKVEALTKAIKDNTTIQDPKLIEALQAVATEQK